MLKVEGGGGYIKKRVNFSAFYLPYAYYQFYGDDITQRSAEIY